MLDIDTAIKHCLEVAGEQQERADSAELIDILDGLDVEDCKECAADHRQLAEWLTELKQWRRVYGVCPSYEMCIPECREGYDAQITEYKRLLKAAVEGFEFLGAWMDEYGECTLDCSDCPLHKPSYYCRGWNKQAEALALIGEDTNVTAREDGAENE